MKKYNPH